MGLFSPYSAGFFVLCGVGMWWYFTNEKAKMYRKKTREASKGVGKPRIGGDFDLTTQNGQRFTSEDMKGKFSLVRREMFNLVIEACGEYEASGVRYLRIGH